MSSAQAPRRLGRDLLRPRAMPLVVAFFPVMLAIAWLDSRLGDEAVRRTPLSALLTSDRDDITAAAWRAIRTRIDEGPAVVLVGSSAMREAVVAESLLQSALGEHGRRDVPVLRLASSGQSLTESLALLSRARLAPGSVIIFHVTPGRMRANEADVAAELAAPRLPFIRSSGFDQNGRLTPTSPWKSPRIVWHRRWLTTYVHGRLRPEVRVCLSSVKHMRVDRSCWRQVRRDGWWRRIPGLPSSFYPDVALTDNAKDGLRALMRVQLAGTSIGTGTVGPTLADATAELARSRGWHLVFMHLPTDPRARPIERLYLGDQVTALGPALARGASYENWLDLPGFDSDDFYDLHHLRPRGRAKLQAHLARLIAEKLPAA